MYHPELQEALLTDELYLEGIEKGREEGIKKGIEKGKKEGMIEGTTSTYIDLYNKKLLTISQVLEQLNISEGEFNKLLNRKN